jgi:1,5-anhydro-D-fructose reductase (1,5-anhydro-D-mannitol-forming)
MNQRTIRCGIIGFGKMGRIRARSIEKTGIASVACIFEPSMSVEATYPNLESPEEVLDSGIDAVFICTPNYLIHPLVISALQKGIHVFAEKPPGISLSQAMEMKEASEKSIGKTLMFGFNHRHHGSIRKMKEIIETGKMGKLLWMRGRYGKEVDESFFDGWRAKKELAGGGIMLDQGIHMLDLFLHLGGGFDEVKSFVSNLFWQIEGVEDNVFAIFRNNKTGVCASIHSTMTQWRYIFSLEIFLEKGSLILNGLKTSSGAYGDEDLAIKYNMQGTQIGVFNEEEHLVFHEDTSWDSETSLFFESVMNGSQPVYGSADDAVKLMILLEKIYFDSKN